MFSDELENSLKKKGDKTCPRRSSKTKWEEE